MTYAAVSVGTPWRSHWAGAPLARLAMERGFARAPPVRSVCHILRGCRSGRLAASMSAAALPDALALDKLPPGIIGARGKVTRSALAKLKLPQLREICSSLGLGAEGKKPALVDRLYAVCSMEDSTASSETPPGDSDSNGSATAQLSSASSANSAPSAVPNVPLEQREAPSTQDTARESSWSVEPKASPVGQRAQQGVGPESFRAAPTGLSVTWLGTSSGAPTQQRNVSCVAVDLGRDGVLLVDAGEGSKRQLARSRIDPRTIQHVCITHMHGDHCFGLPGLLGFISAHKSRQHEADRTPLYIYGPPGIFEWVQTSLRSISTELGMRVQVVEFHNAQAHGHPPIQVDASSKLWLSKAVPLPAAMENACLAAQAARQAGPERIKEEEQRRKWGVINGLSWTFPVGRRFRVSVAQLVHRVPCMGYCIQEANASVSVDSSLLSKHGISEDPKNFEAFVPGRKVVILGDTCDSTSIAALAKGADMVSHEATFSDGMEHKAMIAGHSTSRMAGEFARSINARQLFLTHFSARFQTSNASGTSAYRADSAPEGALGDDMTASDIDTIVAQACEGFGSSDVVAVQDFLTHHVQRRPVHIRRRPSP
eukprot:CAMPEP_0117666794 /NCGR_PEP_ID=MMETSP0804-20121206/10580_1 /TAXON_ID=1074897 /ORGANISM="Tetraselmis astigmatica, Strain CCMP880" /LENGTH=597 /DNA_ID=CAMNT_0005474391 /DNA_START=22 /DNA_END=1815 /DNA_ORIENTATION=-